MTRLIAVARVRNEDDVVEAFVRHHAALVDRLILLDNASDDRTLTILRELKREGLPLTVYDCDSVTFVESAHNTFLLRQAASLGADWVLCLDADEFVDTRGLAGTLRTHLAAVPAEVPCLHIGMVNYQPTGADDLTELNVPRRMVRRSAEPNGAVKVFVRGRLAALGAVVTHGNHDVSLHGEKIRALGDSHLLLAHYPMRSGWQMLAKAIVGRLKVLAAGKAEVDRNTASHYTDLLHVLYQHPEWLLNDTQFLSGSKMPHIVQIKIIEDPLHYLGSMLQYTESVDPRLHAVRSLLSSVEALARRHGSLVSDIEGVQKKTIALESCITQLL